MLILSTYLRGKVLAFLLFQYPEHCVHEACCWLIQCLREGTVCWVRVFFFSTQNHTKTLLKLVAYLCKNFDSNQ